MKHIPLFSEPDAFALKGLGMLSGILDRVMPANGSQRRDLPFACRDLSALLTTQRDALDRPYWATPRLASAYLRYFLPWNLVRLTALLPSMDFGAVPEAPLILDAGSGPLTLPIALWLSRPDLRRLPVTVVASDTVPHVMETGRKIWTELRSALMPDCPWTIRTMRASASRSPRLLRARPGELWMMSMGNVLNEMEDRKARPGSRMSERLRALLEDAHGMLREGGLLLSVEPGNRQGGRLIAHLRKCALGGAGEDEDGDDPIAFALREEQLDAGRRGDGLFDDGGDDEFEFGLPPLFRPAAPCPHSESCPLLDRKTTAWCHVNAPVLHAPDELRELSARAGLDKDSISISFLLLKRIDEDGAEHMEETSRRDRRTRIGDVLDARVISDPFIVPGLPGRARYACTSCGLALIPDSARLTPGELCRGRVMPGFDRKSRAFLLGLDEERTRPRPAGGFRGGEYGGDHRMRGEAEQRPRHDEGGRRNESTLRKRPGRDGRDDRGPRRDAGDRPLRHQSAGRRER